MSEPGDAARRDLDTRVRQLEQEIVQLRMRVDQSSSDSAAARALAAGADRDVSELRAHLRSQLALLNALRETQLEQGIKIDRLVGRVDGLEGRFDGLEGRFDGLEGRFDGLESEMRQGFATVNAGMAQIVTLLSDRDPE